MSHQPYETFLFADEPLTADQQESLQLHLAECERCRTLAITLTNLDEAFSLSTAPSPLPGFTQRWQARLTAHRQDRQIRNLWLLTLGFFALAGSILLIITLFNLDRINWAYELSQFIASFSLFAARTRQLLKILLSLANALPVMLPILLLSVIGAFVAASALTITWFNSLIKLYSPINQRGNLK